MTTDLPDTSWAFIDGLSVNMEKMLDRSMWAINYIICKHLLSNEKLAKESGMSTASIDGYRRGVRLPKIDFLLFLQEKYKLNTEWYLYGRGEPFPGVHDKYPDICGPAQIRFTTIPVPPDFPSDDFVFIRQVAGSISAGGGRVPDDSADFQCAFRRDWIKRKRGNPDNMSLIKVAGDSMTPTLHDGDLVLVDHGRNSIASQGGIYAIAIDDEIMIKRVQPVFPDKLLVISDNKQYPAQEIATENVRVNGKVIWYARDLER